MYVAVAARARSMPLAHSSGCLYELRVPTLRLHQDGRDYFDLHHTADDTVDKLDAASLDQNVAAFAVFAWLVADSDISFRPAFE